MMINIKAGTTFGFTGENKVESEGEDGRLSGQQRNLRETPEERLHRLAALRLAIEAGTYHVSSAVLADCLTQRMLCTRS